MKYTSVWLSPVQPERLPTPLKDEVADVAVIGGGFTGLNAGRVLAKNGANVVLLEQHDLGYGASSRNGGFATTGCSLSYAQLCAAYGEANAKTFFYLSLRAIECIKEVTEEENISCNLEPCGSIILAQKESHFETLKKQAADFKQKLGHRIDILSADEVKSEVGSASFFGGTFDPKSCAIHPVKYLQGLTKAAAHHGVQIHEHTKVQTLGKEGPLWIIETNRGRVRAKEVIVATNGYSHDLNYSPIRQKIMARGSYIIATKILPQQVSRSINKNRRLLFTSGMQSNYFRFDPDNRFLFGGRNNLGTGVALEKSARLLSRKMCGYFPQLEDVPVEFSWSGQLGFTPNIMPYIGRRDGLHYCVGYSGKGIPFSTLMGIEVASRLLGRKAFPVFDLIQQESFSALAKTGLYLPLLNMYQKLKDFRS